MPLPRSTRMLPRLLHPLGIRVIPVDYDATKYDTNANEAIQNVSQRTPIEIRGQIEFRRTLSDGSADLSMHDTGFLADENGYVLFHRRDLDRMSFMPKLNDRIVTLASNRRWSVELDGYIKRIKHEGHYPRFGNCFVKCWFGDRKPARNNTGRIRGVPDGG